MNGGERKPRSRGFALILVLVLLILGLAVSAVIALNLMLATRNLTRKAELVQTTALLDAGMALALSELDADSTWTGARLELEAGVVEISASTETNIRFRRVELEATYRRKVQRAAARVFIPDELSPPAVTSWAPYAEALGEDPLPPTPSDPWTRPWP